MRTFTTHDGTGDLDPAPDLATGQSLSELFTRADVVVQPGAGHVPWLDDPEWFVDAFSRFRSPPGPA